MDQVFHVHNGIRYSVNSVDGAERCDWYSCTYNVYNSFDEPETVEVICHCPGFDLWYVDEDSHIRVCRCGHPQDEHLDSKGSCIGVSERSYG